MDVRDLKISKSAIENSNSLRVRSLTMTTLGQFPIFALDLLLHLLSPCFFPDYFSTLT